MSGPVGGTVGGALRGAIGRADTDPEEGHADPRATDADPRATDAGSVGGRRLCCGRRTGALALPGGEALRGDALRGASIAG